MALIWILNLAITGAIPALPTDPWLNVGGVLGCINLVPSALLIRRIGGLLTGLNMIAAQLIGAVLLDWMLPVAGSIIYAQTVYGTILAVVATVVAAMPGKTLQVFWRGGSTSKQ